jgi:TonB family protein
VQAPELAELANKLANELANGQASKTFVCSVVFVDLVGFSKKPVAQQVAAREALNRILSAVLEPIPEEARIILDTGDGVAMSFLDNAEDALYAGMALRQRVADLPGGNTNVRIGMNIGPVKLGEDKGGGAALIGDGINAAEQIMSFAPPGQVAVSRSFYERVSKLSDAYAQLFRYEGSHTDKHVREHEIYQLGWSDEALEHAVKQVMRKVASESAPEASAAASAATVPATPPSLAAIPQGAEPWGGLIDFLEDKTKVGFAATVLGAAIVALGILVYMKYVPEVPPPMVAQKDMGAQKDLGAPKDAVPSPPSAVQPPLASEAAKPAPQEPAKPVVAEPPKVAPPEPKAVAEPPRSEAKQPPAKAPAKTPAKEPEKTVSPEAAKPKKATPPVEPAKPVPRKQEPAKEAAPATTSPSTAPVQPRREPAPPATSPLRPNALTGGLVPLKRVPVDFPKEAAREGITKGTVKARLSIDAVGKVTRVDILDSRPARVFDRAVRNALVQWTFAPGADNRSYEIEIDFQR